MDVRAWVLRGKSRRRRRVAKWLGWIATRVYTTVWTDHYRRRISSAGAPYHLHVEVQCVQLNYEFGKEMGIRWAIKMTVLIITQYQLTAELCLIKKINRYYGLTRSELFVLLQHELPWLDDLPDGTPGVDRSHDRRPPRWIV